MYGIVLMMAMTNNGANPESLASDVVPNGRYGNQLSTEQYRGRRGGCCGGGRGGRSGRGGCRGGGGYGCSGGYGGCGGGVYRSGYAYDYMPGAGYAYDQGYIAPGAIGWSQPDQEYQSFYFAQPNERDRDMPARLVVFTHPEATLTIDGTSTEQTGTNRTFETPELKAGKTFSYTLRARMPGLDGQMQTVTRKVDVRPGMVSQVVLDARHRQPENVDRPRDRIRDDSKPEEVKPPKDRKEAIPE